jgi:hypothetical protein
MATAAVECAPVSLAPSWRALHPSGNTITHLDRVTVETGQRAVEPRYVLQVDQLLPSIEIAKVRLPRHAAAQPELGSHGWRGLLAGCWLRF